MRTLVAVALGLLAAATQSAAAAPRTETLVTRPGGTIAAFAQDGALIAWFEPSRRDCNRVRLLSLANGLKIGLPLQGGARNVTCRWDVTEPTRLALAGAGPSPSLLWTLREATPLPFDYLIGASAADRRERRFQEVAHTSRGAGLWLGGIAGDRSTLVYGVTSVDYEDEAGCLAGTGSCALTRSGGGVYRVSGRQPPKLIPGTVRAGAVEVALSGDIVAYVPAGTAVAKDGRPVAADDLPIEVIDTTTGAPVASVPPDGIAEAIALSAHVLAALERSPLGLSLAWYDSASGKPLGSVSVPAETSPELSTTDRVAVFRVGRSIRSVDLTTGRVRILAQAAAVPVGLSVEGGRVAWAENLASGGRIRALYLSGHG
jgi:hypothetical protein